MQAVSIVSEHEVGGAFAGDVFFFSFLFAIRTTVVRGVCVSGGKRTLGGYSGVAPGATCEPAGALRCTESTSRIVAAALHPMPSRMECVFIASEVFLPNPG